MQIVINIPKQTYNFIMNRQYMPVDEDLIVEAVRNGTPLEQEPKTGWIPVSERLPEKNGQYLVTVKKGYMLLGLWCGIKDNWINVIAWMPLPEPYKAESEVR